MVTDYLSVWFGVFFAITASIILNILLYPLLLAWVLMSYFVLQPELLEE